MCKHHNKSEREVVMTTFRRGDTVAVKGDLAKGYGTVVNVTDNCTAVLIGDRIIKYNDADVSAGKVKPKFI